jgi:hypothetical protein
MRSIISEHRHVVFPEERHVDAPHQDASTTGDVHADWSSAQVGHRKQHCGMFVAVPLFDVLLSR